MAGKMVTIDGNEATARIAYMLSEVAAIYPITPSSVMGELADEWSAMNRKNLFGEKLEVVELQHEGGAAGAVHGSLVAGALTTTFTASQGLLLMIPNMYKIAGEMLPTVFHVSARSLAAQSLSIFGDHTDVMATRQTGFAMIASTSVQECLDTALVAHMATLKCDIPFLHFFDGFRTSHEVQKVEEISEETVKSLIDMKDIERFRKRALRPEAAMCRVGAQNPDVYFQGRETTNKHYDAVAGIVQDCFDKVGAKTGRKFKLFDYVGAADADKVIICIGSGAETVAETVKTLNAKGAKLGVIIVRLYRPFATSAFLAAVPKTVKKIAVLDRTKEPGAAGEPLYLDVVDALKGKPVTIIGGRYGLSSKEFTPSMVATIFKHLDGKCTHGFTIGINDDVTNLSLAVTENVSTEPEGTKSCMFWGLGSDGTVGANKESIKMIGNNTDKYAQAYFVYDSKKSYGITISHLRFGDQPIRSPYLISNPDFVACHNSAYLGRYDMLSGIKEGGTFLLNSDWSNDEVFSHLTVAEQKIIRDRKIKFYNINALKISEAAGLGARINTVMQAAFFKVAGIFPQDKSIELIKKGIQKAYGKKGEEIVKMNWAAVDSTSAALEEVKIPASSGAYVAPKLIADDASAFAKDIIEPGMYLKGDDIPVSKMSYDGVIPTGTTCLEKRCIAPRVPKWVSANCIQCNQCVMACPHAVVRAKQIDPKLLDKKPAAFETVVSKTKNDKSLQYRLQIYVEDCTGCGVCVETCPAKVKALEFTTLDAEKAAGQKANVDFFINLPENVTDGAATDTVKGAMFLQPLFEFSGACAGCGETPYVKLVTQLFGERMMIANATGCTSIYGGTFPTIPYTKSQISGNGPSWGNSLFEDNAEYGFGMRLAVDNNRKMLKSAIDTVLAAGTTPELAAALTKAVELWASTGREAIDQQKLVVSLLPAAQAAATDANRAPLAKIVELKDYFVDKSVWIFGGDGWAYDIGYSGLDHVMASGRNVNVLVVDTEVYSNTGGQASKSTPIAAVAKFATAGKRLPKKNLGLMMMSYGYVYVASISMGANRNQTLKAIREAEAYNGPSIIIAYAPCIAHGINMMKTQVEQKRAVEAGYWPLYRYNPLAEKPFIWETPEVSASYQDFILGESRYKQLGRAVSPEEAKELYAKAQKDAERRMGFFKKLAEMQ
jgi:pyruvate-ferredoxin/flavodoxin oxidoreductase